MKRTALAILISSALAAPAHAQLAGDRPFRVSAKPLSTQVFAATDVTETLDHDLVFAWGEGQFSAQQVFAQRTDRWGHRLGSAIPVASPANGGAPRVAAIGAGGFVAVWTEQVTTLRGRCFDRDGLPLGSAFGIGSGLAYRVAADAQGSFVVAWILPTGGGGTVVAQRYSATCAATGPVITVSPTANASLDAAIAVASAPDGRFVVAWEDPDGDQTGIFARRFAADGTPAGPAFLANNDITSYQRRPAASVGFDGSFVIAWDGDGLFARRFDAGGAPLGSQVPVDGQFALLAEVTHLTTGGFVVAWITRDLQNDVAVKLRRFDASGVPDGPLTVGASFYPFAFLHVVAQPDGFACVGWPRHDGPQDEIVGRRFGPLVAQAAAADGNGILEPGEDVTWVPSWLNATGGAITLGGIAPAFDGPPAPGVFYRLTDTAASYGTLLDGGVSACTATGDCYGIGLSAPPARPAVHWDARLDEAVRWGTASVTQRWIVHVGESFADVPRASAFYPFVETILHHDVTGGCTATDYCPASPISREQMAVFVLRSRHEGYLPWGCNGSPRRFGDVPASSPYCGWIEDLAGHGLNGCGNGNYCPLAAVSRQEMAVFVLVVKDGIGNAPPDCMTPMFADVPATSPYCAWIEELARRGIVAGCGNGNYCPTAAVTREQMSVFLAATFGLSLGAP